ncbi:MAG TPA: hypothetical protein VGE15_11220 [Sphingobacteriaceae bacterium]
MENVFTTMITGVVIPVQEEKCHDDIRCTTFSHAVLHPEELTVIDLIRMVSAMNRSIARPNKTNPAEYNFYCGIMD